MTLKIIFLPIHNLLPLANTVKKEANFFIHTTTSDNLRRLSAICHGVELLN